MGWILAENWWPYQRPSFVTPPFAGYVSGHSIWGGIHPPADDIPGRLIGERVGIAAFHLAERYFFGQVE